MNNSQTFRIERVCDPTATDEYKKYAWERMKREAGLDLYRLLEQQKTPVVVELFEDIKEFPEKKIEYWSPFDQRYVPLGSEYGYDKLRIEIRFTPVEHRHVTYQVTPDMTEYLRNYKPRWIDKVRKVLLDIWKECETALLK